MLKRRAFLKKASIAAVVAPMVCRGAFVIAATPDREYSRRAIDLVNETLVIDMLAPLTLDLSPDATAKPLTAQAIDDFRVSGITGFHNSFGIGGPEAYDATLAYMAAWQGYCGRNPDRFALIGTMADLVAAKAAGRTGVIMGVQNAEHFRTADDVALFYKLGQRCSQLTYNSQNLIGSGSTDRVDGGVSDFGVGIIKAMEASGMLIDVSHSGDRTTLDAVELAGGPIAFTHSNCRAISGHPRTKTDEAIKALAAKGGVMGITGVRMFVSKTDPTDIGNIVDHIDHVARLVGIEHVGIGSDSDLNGYDDMAPDQYAALKAAYKKSYAFRDKIDVDGFDHPQKMYDLTEELIKRGYSNRDIQGVLGKNFQGLLTQIWK